MIIFTPNTVIRSTDINGNFNELKTKTDYLSAPDSGWITVTYQNSWVKYDTTYNVPAYRKDALGYVHIRGMIANGSSATATMFTLPAGYRPELRILSAAYSAAGLCRLDVLTDGQVQAVTGGSVTWTSLENLQCFKAFA